MFSSVLSCGVPVSWPLCRGGNMGNAQQDVVDEAGRTTGTLVGHGSSAGRVIVLLFGELDIASVHALGSVGRAVAENPGAEVVVDLRGVTFLDSSALEAFASARAQATAGGGSLSLTGASSFAHKLLQIWQLEPGTPDL
jgi:anti-sigma B factor antagonist